jgi:hypothetical protein
MGETVKLIAILVPPWRKELHLRATGNKTGLHFPGMPRISVLSTTPRLALKPIWYSVKRVS